MMRRLVVASALAASAIVGSVPVALAAQTRAPAPAALVERASPSTVPARVGDWLVAEVAQRWAVPPERIELDWGATPAPFRDRSPEGADLSGGAAGEWSVTLAAAPADGPRRVLVRAGVRVRRPVAARELARGTELVDDDVRWVEKTVWGPPGAMPRDPAGLHTQRRISTGEELVEPAVVPGPWVEARAPVEVVLEKGRVTIALRGTALADALPGERVHVRLEDGRRVQGRTIAPGRVALDAGGDR